MKKRNVKRKSIKKNLVISFTLIVVVLITVIEIISYSSIKAISKQSASNYEKAVITGYKNEISQETNLVISVIQEKYNSYKSGAKTEEEAKEEVKEDCT